MLNLGERREWVMRRLLNGEGVRELSAESGFGLSTLYRWRLQAQQGEERVSKGKKDRLSGAQKLSVLAETVGLNEAELSEYCRQKGLYAD